MKRTLIWMAAGLIGMVVISEVEAQHSWYMGMALGDAYCFPGALSLQQSSHPEIHLRARFATHSFQPPIYYAIKVGHDRNAKGWEMELVHLKIKLKNTTETIQRFEVSHGFNLVTVLRGWKWGHFRWQFGAGMVIAHPENTVRSMKLSENRGIFHSGYYIVGPNFQLTIAKPLFTWSVFSCYISGKIAGAYCWIPIAQGQARLAMLALHGLIGLSYSF